MLYVLKRNKNMFAVLLLFLFSATRIEKKLEIVSKKMVRITFEKYKVRIVYNINQVLIYLSSAFTEKHFSVSIQ